MIREIKNVTDIVLFNNHIYTVGDEKYTHLDLRLKNGGVGCFIEHNGLLYYQSGRFNKIEVFDKSLKKIYEIEPGFDLYYSYPMGDYRLMVNRPTMSYWKFFSFDRMEDTGKRSDYNRKIGNHFFTVYGTLIKCYPPLATKEKWSVEAAAYGFAVDVDNAGNTTNLPNTVEISSGITGNDDAIFLPLTGGQLLALNVEDGSIKWMIGSPTDRLIGYQVLYKNFIYTSNGNKLFEIDIKSGEILRVLVFKDIFGEIMHWPAGQFKVYEDAVLFKDSRGYQITLIDRKEFTILESFQLDNWDSTLLASDASIMHWHNNKIYIVDLSGILHIYEKDK